MLRVREFLTNHKMNVLTCVPDVIETIFKALHIYSEKFKKIEDELKPAIEHSQRATIDTEFLKKKFEDLKISQMKVSENEQK